MHRRGPSNRAFLCGLALLLVSPVITRAEDDDAAWAKSLEKTAADYATRLQAANDELVSTRERITNEKLPLEESRTEAEAKLNDVRIAVAQLELTQAQSEARRQQLKSELDGLVRNLGYVTTLARDTTQVMRDALAPGQGQRVGDRLDALRTKLEDSANLQNSELAGEAVDLTMERVSAIIGGELAPGSATRQGDNALVDGTFAWLGPEAFFLSGDQKVFGTVRLREGVPVPVVHAMTARLQDDAVAVFKGDAGVLPLDPSGGKALRLVEVRGSWVDHVKKGGPIGYVIIALGGLAILTTLLKILDIRHVEVDTPADIGRILGLVQAAPVDEVKRAVSKLRPTMRDLFEVGLQHLEKPKMVLEDHLYAGLLRHRMNLERRLSFLTVIVAAAPLLGLLGTVTGMIKTFTLINVFGTGNAAKLSSGISEALVTTELGLMVAIPTLVVHGFLSRRTQRDLAQMEQYAAEFTAAAAERNGVTSSDTDSAVS